MTSQEEEAVALVTVLNENIPIYHSQQILSPETVEKAIGSKPFTEWVDNIELSGCFLRSMLHNYIILRLLHDRTHTFVMLYVM
jgi:hypothetical protein